MYRTRPFAISLCAAAALALAACGDEPEAGDGIIGADVVSDSGSDRGDDVADTGGDDLRVDQGLDSAQDLAEDTAPDGGPDVTPDALADADLIEDAGLDAFSDADLIEDAGPDAFSDADAALDLVADAVPDLPTCADIDCGDATCEIEAGVGAVCTCDEGYAFDTGACVIDPLEGDDFSDPRWTLLGGGTVDDTGAYLGTAEMACNRFGVETEIELPVERPAGTNPVLEVSYLGAECEGDACLDTETPSLFFALGDREFPVPRSLPTGDPQTLSYCLGDHAFDTGPQTLSFGAVLAPEFLDEPCTALDVWLAAIESVTIREAETDECPQAYGVQNGDFDTGDLTSWTFDASGLAEKGVIDRDGDGVLVIDMSSPRCDATTLSQSIDVPAADRTAPLALRAVFDFASAVGFEANYSLTLSDGAPRTRLTQIGHFGRLLDGDSRTFETCLPFWAYGRPLKLALAFNGTDGAECTAEENATVIVETVTLVENEACLTDGTLDDDFEAGLLHWWTRHLVGNSDADTFPALIEHSDEEGWFLRLEAPEVCSNSSITVPVRLDEGAEAVVRFRYRAFEDVPTFDNANTGPGNTLLTNASEWTDATGCLQRLPGESNPSVSFQSSLDGRCADPYTAYLEIDDVVVDRDAACP